MALTNKKELSCFCDIDKPKFRFKIEKEVFKDRSPLLCSNCNMTINEHNFFYYPPFTEYITKKDENNTIIVKLPKYEFIFDKQDVLVLT